MVLKMKRNRPIRWPLFLVSYLTKRDYRESGGTIDIPETFADNFENVFGFPMEDHDTPDSKLGQAIYKLIKEVFHYAERYDRHWKNNA